MTLWAWAVMLLLTACAEVPVFSIDYAVSDQCKPPTFCVAVTPALVTDYWWLKEQVVISAAELRSCRHLNRMNQLN